MLSFLEGQVVSTSDFLVLECFGIGFEISMPERDMEELEIGEITLRDIVKELEKPLQNYLQKHSEEKASTDIKSKLTEQTEMQTTCQELEKM